MSAEQIFYLVMGGLAVLAFCIALFAKNPPEL